MNKSELYDKGFIASCVIGFMVGSVFGTAIAIVAATEPILR